VTAAAVQIALCLLILLHIYAIGERLYDHIVNANDNEDSNYSFGEIAQNMVNDYVDC
jgi:hypothetical protein